ncbi:hypothetical protein GH714_043976 [Hevea brasiliensis]|uniref:Uncharacterized protein n=1 Tax=Hevea brasiliensis TaxID=3981 RepID=A0A6A6K190_HEVBR|nr:hypothetical protein GH714_043976 [Hevea brasiliensis]
MEISLLALSPPLPRRLEVGKNRKKIPCVVGPARHGSGPFAAIVGNESVVESYIKCVEWMLVHGASMAFACCACADVRADMRCTGHGSFGWPTLAWDSCLLGVLKLPCGGKVTSAIDESVVGMSKVLPKFMSSSRMREEFGSIEMRLDKVEGHLSREQAIVDRIEDHLIRGDDRFEELGSRVSELGEGLEETRGEFQAVLNETRDKLMSETEALKIAHAEEMSTVRKDNHVLQERVEQLQEEVKQLREEMVLLKRLVTRENGTSPHSTLSVPMARVEKPEPGASKEEGSAGRRHSTAGVKTEEVQGMC